MDTADRAHEVIQVGSHVTEHAASITLDFHVNLELNRHDKALLSSAFDPDMKAQLQTLLLGHDILFWGKLDKASGQAEERSCHQRELKVGSMVHQSHIQVISAPAPSYSFQASG